MPMGDPARKGKPRQSTHNGIEIILEQAESAFLSALSMSAMNGGVEDVRQACVSLASLRAFQTCLGNGSPAVTAAAAGTLGLY